MGSGFLARCAACGHKETHLLGSGMLTFADYEQINFRLFICITCKSLFSRPARNLVYPCKCGNEESITSFLLGKMFGREKLNLPDRVYGCSRCKSNPPLKEVLKSAEERPLSKCSCGGELTPVKRPPHRWTCPRCGSRTMAPVSYLLWD